STTEGYSQLSIRVEGGTAASEEIVRSGSRDIDSFDTVPDLFNVIRKALIAKDESGFNELDIQYNEDTGHPTYIALCDPHKLGDPGTYSYSIIDFKILEQDQTAK
ncbi:MAG: DUF6174 domain-containing protein, partial [Dehalococcoidales bacterium]|nr:DUF6174 domain-containing protein [Dehalococcoidales bacterium]